MRVLVTGATGFLGYRFIERYHTEYELVATGRNLKMGEKIRYLGVDFQRAQIDDADAIDALVEGVDAVVHSAGLSSPWGRYDDFYQANVQGTQSVVDACLKHGVKRLVHISTPSLYAENKDKSDVRESDPLPAQFANHYAATKHLGDQIVFKAAEESGLEAVLLRPRALIGRGDTVIMPRLLRAHQEGRLRVIGNGRNWVDLTAVSNVCHAIDLALHSGPETWGEAFNITNGKPVRLWDTLEEALARLGLKLNRSKIPFVLAYSMAAGMEMAAKADPSYAEPPLTRYGVMMLSRTQTLNIDKARELLGYTPQQSTNDAMDEFIQWWKRSQWLN